MTVTDWLTIVAIFLGPIVAVRVIRYLDDKKEARERKLRVFKTLMARAERHCPQLMSRR